METVSIPKADYQLYQQQLAIYQQRLNYQNDKEFWYGLNNVVYLFGSPPPPAEAPVVERLPLKRGSGRHVITHIADDFDAPLDDFKDYM